MIIGSENLRRLQFQYEGDQPPYVYATTSDEALQLCQELVKISKEQLYEHEQRRLRNNSSDDNERYYTVVDEMRLDVTEWYARVYQNINNRVRYTLESFG